MCMAKLLTRRERVCRYARGFVIERIAMHKSSPCHLLLSPSTKKFSTRSTLEYTHEHR